MGWLMSFRGDIVANWWLNSSRIHLKLTRPSCINALINLGPMETWAIETNQEFRKNQQTFSSRFILNFKVQDIQSPRALLAQLLGIIHRQSAFDSIICPYGLHTVPSTTQITFC